MLSHEPAAAKRSRSASTASYALIASKKGTKEVAAATQIFKETTGH
jgi:hypothetical protein